MPATSRFGSFVWIPERARKQGFDGSELFAAWYVFFPVGAG